MRTFPIVLGICLLLALPPRAIAHFRLLEPASWIQESERGDPQWSPPCGGTLTDPGKPTGAITKIEGGETLHIRIREMAFHPGFYRVALAVNSRNELPPDPEAVSELEPGGRSRSVSRAIHYPPSPPVLADGLFMHVAPFANEQETDVAIPNISCAKCTLQVIESWRRMAETRMATTPTIIAPTSRSIRARTSRSIQDSQVIRNSADTHGSGMSTRPRLRCQVTAGRTVQGTTFTS